MTIPHNPGPYTIMHESIHVYNDWVDKYEGARDDEGLAYAAHNMAKQLERFQKLEKELKKEKPNIQQLKKFWQTSWVFVDVVDSITVRADGEDSQVTVQDVQRVKSHLGFHVSCNAFKAKYNELPATKNVCVEFLCSPNDKPSKPWLIPINTLLELNEPFK